MSTFEREVQVATQAVRAASTLCQAVQREITRESLEKKDKSPVTVADFGSQALVCRALELAFPADPIIAEEDSAGLRAADSSAMLGRVVAQVQRAAGSAPDAREVCRWIDRGSQKEFGPRFWTLDPIDGTKGFLRSEQYAVALALIVDGQIVVSALACPNLPAGDGRGAIFTAVRGRGAMCVGLAGGTATSVRVSATADARQARFCESVESGHSAHGDSEQVAARLGITQPPVRMDSQAKYASVARGDADIYLRLPTRQDYREKIWDHAAGVLVIEEAGGRVSDVTGQPLDFTHGSELRANQGVIVTNGRLHEPVVAAVRAVLAQGPRH